MKRIYPIGFVIWCKDFLWWIVWYKKEAICQRVAKPLEEFVCVQNKRQTGHLAYMPIW